MIRDRGGQACYCGQRALPPSAFALLDAMPHTGNSELRRALGVWSAGSLVVGAMVGTGIFFFVAPVAAQLGSGPAILSAWLVGVLIASCGALCMAELASAYPQTGGIYVFLRRAYGPYASFLYAWTAFLVLRVGTLSIFAIAFATFTSDFLRLDDRSAAAASVPIALIAVLSVSTVNIIGVRQGAGIQNLLTATKLICLLAMVAVGAWFAMGLLPAHETQIIAIPTAQGSTLARFALALVPIMWTLGGWDESPFVAEEVHSPQRNLPLSILGGLWIVGALYIATNFAYLGILTPAEVAGSGERTATLAMHRALGPSANAALSFALMVSTLGAANGMTLTGARIAYATGRDHPLFGWLATVNRTTKTPIRALLTQAALVCLVIVAIPEPYLLLLYTGVAYWTFAGLTALALVVLRIREPTKPRPFRAWAYPLPPIVFTLATAGMVVAVSLEGVEYAGATAMIFVAGSLAFLLQRILERRDLSKPGQSNIQST